DLAELKGMVTAHWKNILASTRRSAIPPLIKLSVEKAHQAYFICQMDLRDTELHRLIAGQKASMTGERWVEISDPGLSAILAISTTALRLCGQRAQVLADDA